MHILGKERQREREKKRTTSGDIFGADILKVVEREKKCGGVIGRTEGCIRKKE